MKAALGFLVIILCWSATGLAQEQRDTLKLLVPNQYPVAYGQKNWMGVTGSYSLNRKYIPFDASYKFPAALFFSDRLFKNTLTGNRFSLPADLELYNCAFYEDSTDSYDFFLGESYHALKNHIIDSNIPAINNFIFPTLQKQKNYIDIKGNFTVTQCESEAAIAFSFLKNEEHEMSFFRNKFSWINLDDIKTYTLSLAENEIRVVSLANCTIKEFIISGDTIGHFNKAYSTFYKQYWNDLVNDISKKQGTQAKQEVLDIMKDIPVTDSVPDAYTIKNENSEFGSINFQDIKAKLITVDFTNCRINGDYSFSDPIPEDQDMEHFAGIIKEINLRDTMTERNAWLTASFDNTFINGKISNPRQKRYLEYDFNKCIFGDNADLSELYFDKIVVTNCTKIATDIYLTFPGTSEVDISIINSDLDKIHFDYRSNLHFIPNPYGDETNDQINNAYIPLLDKFRREGKEESFARLDVEHRQWQYAQRGIWGTLLNTLDHYWWYYGYRKHYIIYWSLAMLLLFAILNFWWWSRFKSIYPVIQNESSASYFDRIKNNKNRQLIKSMHVLIITFFIFFSFRLEFDKISYKNTRMVLFFFVQYIVGLICLFFIVNFILKS